MTLKDKLLAQRIYLLLGALFITSLVVSNLIFKKFFYWYPFDIEIFGTKLFEISVGILPYPITFLITDLISEIYGKKRANQIVVTGIFASIFSLTIVFVSNAVPATNWSPVGDHMFSTVFGNTALAVFASMLAYLFAQFIDIQIYHFWKRITKGTLNVVKAVIPVQSGASRMLICFSSTTNPKAYSILSPSNLNKLDHLLIFIVVLAATAAFFLASLNVKPDSKDCS